MKETLFRSIGGKMLSKVKLFVMSVICVTVSLVWADYPIMSQHYAADPTAIEWNGRLYVYCSNDEENTENSGYIMDSIACFSTDDLKNWTDHGVVFDADELSSWYSGTAWAPCIVQNHGQLYLYFGDAYWGISVVTSTSPTGPFTAPKNDLVVKRESIPGGTPGANSTWLFDPGVFVDDDGTPHLYFGGGGANQCRYIELNPNMYDSVGSAVTIPFSDFFEASHIHKYNGIYYLSYADNYEDSTPSSQIAYMTSSDPAGPFMYQGVALGQPPYNYGNNNHHTFFTYQGQWYCVYHNRYQATVDGVSTTEHRNICLDQMYYNPDGTIQPIIHTQDGLPQLKNLDPFTRVEGETLNAQSGLRTGVCSEGGMNVTSIDNGDWIRVRGVDFGAGAGSFLARVASTNTGGSIELRLDSLTGTLVGTCVVPNTGGAQTWTTAICAVNGASGVHDLYLIFEGSAGSDLFNVNWWQFQAASLTSTTVTLDSSTIYQTIEGLGGAIAFYNGWIPAHPYHQEIYDYAFAGLNLSMLRLGNWWRGTDGEDTAAYEIAAAANESLGRPVPIMMSSWSPPAYLKSNDEVGNGGTLIGGPSNYDYEGFADYWYDSLQDYIAHGVIPTWISIQNEPDWTAEYDSCRFNPTEAPWHGESYASYALALDAVYQRLEADLPSPPKLLGPENVGLNFSPTAQAYQDYAAAMDTEHFYGMAHHLYGGSTDGTPDGYIPVFNTVATVHPDKPRFMTEFGYNDMIDSANLIHNSLVYEQVSGYNHWSLIWPGEGGLVEIEFPWDPASWTNPKGYWLNPSYWSMKHFSYYITPGFRRVEASSSDPDVLVSAYLSPDDLRLVAVFINRSTSTPSTVTLDSGSFTYDYSSVYQTVGLNHFESLGEISGSQLTLPASSLTTVLLDKEVTVGSATNPSPVNGATEVSLNTTLTWSPGTNAMTHAIYLGTDYNAVDTATLASPEYQDTVYPNSFTPTALTSGTTYYWRVDEIAYSSSDHGSVWSFSTTQPVPVAYLRFDETSGTTASDATGNGWTGTLVNGPLWSTGKYHNAVNLDGTNDYVRLPTGVVNGLTDFTISAWVYLDVVSTWSRVFDFGNNTTVNMFLTPRASSGTVRFAITTGGAGAEQVINGSNALPSGAWTHVAVTHSGNTGILYVNGAEVGRNSSMSLTPDSLGATTQNYIGKSQYADPYLNGRVDDFRIYSATLSAADVAALASNNAPYFTSDPIDKPDAIEDAAYSGQTLAGNASDPDGDPLTFSKVSGPAWLTVATDGSLSGTPSDSDTGPNVFTVRVEDTGGLYDTAGMTIDVANIYSGVRGMEDLAGLVAQWLNFDCTDIPPCDGADLDGDADVDFLDFAQLANNW
jgi:arabinoxylan arabinofuranohydrolase